MKSLAAIDRSIIRTCLRISGPLSRFALFVAYGWFGFLKVIGQSPASPLVTALQERTIPFMEPGTFLVVFGIIEVIIGIMFLVRGWERVAILFLAIHLFTTGGPLIFLPEYTWTGFLMPTLEGQYIIKNLALAAVAIGIAAHLTPMDRHR